MPITTIRKATTKRPATRRRVVTKPVPPVEPPFAAEPLPVAEREFWVLRSQWDQFDGPEYFYDGQIEVRHGVAHVPASRIDWAKRLLFSGYSFVNPADEPAFNAAIEA